MVKQAFPSFGGSLFTIFFAQHHSLAAVHIVFGYEFPQQLLWFGKLVTAKKYFFAFYVKPKYLMRRAMTTRMFIPDTRFKLTAAFNESYLSSFGLSRFKYFNMVR